MASTAILSPTNLSFPNSPTFEKHYHVHAESSQAPHLQPKAALSPVIKSRVVSANTIISSPYTTPEHLLDLETLEAVPKAVAVALQGMRNITPDYARLSYEESFNWDEVFQNLYPALSTVDYAPTAAEPATFLAVAFRSQLFPTINLPLLSLLDERSHAEANISGGLLKYWFGSPNGERKNLATCLWRDEEDAKLGGKGEWHRRARVEARGFYEKISFERYELRLWVESDGQRGGKGTVGWEFRKL